MWLIFEAGTYIFGYTDIQGGVLKNLHIIISNEKKVPLFEPSKINAITPISEMIVS